MPDLPIAIIGAGLAGLSCAAALRARGAAVTLFDKARGPGGRLSTRRVPSEAGEALFDHGAMVLTATTPGFTAELARWERHGLAARWHAAGPGAFVGMPGMNTPIKQLASAQRVHWECRIEAIERGADGWRLVGDPDDGMYQRLVLAIPPEQAAQLLAPVAPDLAAFASAQRSEPCWTLMAAFDPALATTTHWLEPTQGPIARLACNRAKPGRSGPDSWVVQAHAAWSETHLEDSADEVQAALLGALFDALELPPRAPLVAQAHRWRYARAVGAGTPARWEDSLGLGLCGDWLLGPSAEHAWQSGNALAAILAADASAR